MARFPVLFLAALFLVCNAGAEKVKHVILIGIDGLGANYISKQEMPTLASLMARGSYSLHARSVLPSSSAANWASMFMGASPEVHGYTEWNSETPEIPSRVLDRYGFFPTIYGILREQRPKSDIDVFYDWSGIGYLFPKQAVTTAGTGKDDSEIVDKVTRCIKSNKPTLLLAYMEGPDEAGHGKGWGSPAYLQQESEIDHNIAAILQAIHDAGIEDSTVVIVSADHGGLNTGHGGKTLKEMEIPWVIAGPGIKSGYEIQDSIMTYDHGRNHCLPSQAKNTAGMDRSSGQVGLKQIDPQRKDKPYAFQSSQQISSMNDCVS